jgi:hypothetical protein
MIGYAAGGFVSERPTQLTIRDERNGDAYSFCCVKIGDGGSLVLETVDGGPEVERLFGDSDVEPFVTVKPEDKDAVLLHLVKAQFSSAHVFKQWLAEHGIEAGSHVY